MPRHLHLLTRCTIVSMGGLLLTGCASRHAGSTTASLDPIIVFQPPSPEALAAITHPDLRNELLTMADEDQFARRGIRSNRRGGSVERLHDVDRRNTLRLKELVGTYGWPTRSMVADDGAQAAWLLVQHADHDVAWQRQCLATLKPLLETKEAFAGNVAYLTDRVLVNEGKPQTYGSQFHMVDGRQQPRPMQDPDNVDARRKEMGLSTLEQYRKLMRT